MKRMLAYIIYFPSFLFNIVILTYIVHCFGFFTCHELGCIGLCCVVLMYIFIFFLFCLSIFLLVYGYTIYTLICICMMNYVNYMIIIYFQKLCKINMISCCQRFHVFFQYIGCFFIRFRL